MTNINFIQALRKRHTELILGYNGKIYDRQLLGFLTYEAVMLTGSSLQLEKINNIWYVSSKDDWIGSLCNDDSYLFEVNYLPNSDPFHHLAGVVLSAF